MDESFDLLEVRIRKAADMVRRLRGENARLAEELERARKRAAEAEKRAAAAAKKGTGRGELEGQVESLTEEVAVLRRERDIIRGRIEKLVTILEELD